jgi:hypothetical protein
MNPRGESVEVSQVEWETVRLMAHRLGVETAARWMARQKKDQLNMEHGGVLAPLIVWLFAPISRRQIETELRQALEAEGQ